MSKSSPSVERVARLTTSQIAQFKREGFLVLPGALDPELCRQARDQMWDAIGEHRPSMKRDDPSTWGPITEDEAAAQASQFDAYFAGKGERLYVCNGADELMLDLAPRALWDVAEQMLGEGEIVWPAGLDESGFATGPCHMSDDVMENLWGADLDKWPGEPSFKTEELRLPRTSHTHLSGQGTRGLYCTLPNSPSPGPNWRGAHSDGAAYGRTRLQFAAYIDDLPPASGGFTVWPGSHTRCWETHWKVFHGGETHVARRDRVRKAGGYEFIADPIYEAVKGDTEPVDTYGPAGTVVLWHTKILHMVGQNTSNDVIRQATIYGYQKTVGSLSDELAMTDAGGDVWRDWSDEVRATEI